MQNRRYGITFFSITWQRRGQGLMEKHILDAGNDSKRIAGEMF